MERTVQVLCCLLMACGNSSGGTQTPAPTPNEVAQQEPTAVSPENNPQNPPPGPGDVEAERAIAAYSALRSAYRSGDETRYIQHYAERLTCFYNTANMSRDDVLGIRSAALRQNRTPNHHERIHSIRLDVISLDSDGIVLHDWGWTGEGGNRTNTVFHAKRIRLSRQQGQWRVSAESNINAACGLTTTPQPAPPEWTHLRNAYHSMVASCEEGPDAPGLGGSIGCDCGMNMLSAEDYCRALFRCTGRELSGPCMDRRLTDCIAGPGREVELFCA